MSGKFHSIVSKISKLTIAVAVISTVAASGVLFAYSASAIRSVTDSKTEAEVETSARKMETWFAQKINLVDDLVGNVEYNKYTTDNSDEAEDYLAGIYNGNNDVYSYSLGLENGDSYFSDRWDGKAEGYDPRTRDWYISAASSDDIVISAPYVDAMTGKMVVTISKRIQEGGKLTGVVAADVNVDTIIQMTDGIISTESGYPMLIDAAGTVLVHRDSKYVPYVDSQENEHFTNIDDIGISFARTETSSNSVSKDYDGVKRIFVQAPIENAGWTFMLALDYGYYNSATITMIIISLVIFAVCLAASILIARLVVGRTIKPMENINSIAENMKQGVLSFDNSYNNNDEIGNLYSGVEQSNSNIKMYLNDIDDKLSAMADGNFTKKFDVEYLGDFKSVNMSMQKIQSALRGTLQNIDRSARSVANGAEQLAVA